MESTTLPALELYPTDEARDFAPEVLPLADGPVVIGRYLFKPGARALNCKAVSRKHAEVWEDGGTVWIRDLKSSNGTFVNSRDISHSQEPVALSSEDIVRFGRTVDDKGASCRPIVARIVCLLAQDSPQAAIPGGSKYEGLMRYKQREQIRFDSLSGIAEDAWSWRRSTAAHALQEANPSPGDSSRALENMWRLSFMESLDTLDSTVFQGSVWISSQDLQRETTDGASHPVKYGGLSDIYRGRLKRGSASAQVAIKKLRVGVRSLDKVLRSLRREVRVWKGLQHPYILPFYGLFSTDGHGGLPGMVSPWCDNGHIINYLATFRDYPHIHKIKIALLYQVAMGLKYLHAYTQCIVHGDLKGANILISEEGRAQLCDFGLSNMLAEHSEEFTTASSGIKGTCRFMAPELFASDDARPTTQSDIWAYGCVMLEVLSGQLPYHAKSRDPQVIWALARNELPARPDNIDDDHWEVALLCWTIEPNARPPVEAVKEKIRALSMRAFIGAPGTLEGSSVRSVFGH